MLFCESYFRKGVFIVRVSGNLNNDTIYIFKKEITSIIKYFEINFEGINVKCKIYSPDPSNIKNVIISCHGYGGSKENKASYSL